MSTNFNGTPPSQEIKNIVIDNYIKGSLDLIMVMLKELTVEKLSQTPDVASFLHMVLQSLNEEVLVHVDGLLHDELKFRKILR